MINWKVRFKNKNFWMAIIPAVLLLAQQVCSVFGVSLDTAVISEQLLGIVGTAFVVLAIVGVVNDPTTDGLNDSEQAMTYVQPKK